MTARAWLDFTCQALLENSAPKSFVSCRAIHYFFRVMPYQMRYQRFWYQSMYTRYWSQISCDLPHLLCHIMSIGFLLMSSVPCRFKPKRIHVSMPCRSQPDTCLEANVAVLKHCMSYFLRANDSVYIINRIILRRCAS